MIIIITETPPITALSLPIIALSFLIRFTYPRMSWKIIKVFLISLLFHFCVLHLPNSLYIGTIWYIWYINLVYCISNVNNTVYTLYMKLILNTSGRDNVN